MSTVNPYSSPQEPLGQTPALYAPSQYSVVVPFQSLQGIATAVKALLGIVALAKAAAIGATLHLIVQLGGGADFSGGAVQIAAAILGLTVIATVLLSLVAGIVYLVWLYRAYQNLPALGVTSLEATPGWAVGHYFIPILNLYRPYQTIVEIWRGSITREQMMAGKTSSSIAGWWWAGWIIAALLGQVSGAMVRGDSLDPGLLSAAAWLDIVMHVVSLGTALLAIVIVHRISNNQERKNAEVQAQSPISSMPNAFGQPLGPALFPQSNGLSPRNPFGEPGAEV